MQLAPIMSEFDVDTVPLAKIGEETEPIVIDTAERVKPFVVFVHEPPPRPKWADGVVPRKNKWRR